MAGTPLDPDEWELVLGKLLRYHQDIQIEIAKIIHQIRHDGRTKNTKKYGA